MIKVKVNPEDRARVWNKVWRKWMLAFTGIGLILLIVGLARVLFVREDIGAFRDFCRSIERGWPLSEVRKEAEARGYFFEPDPEPAGFKDDPTFVIRPTRDWLPRFSCRVIARGGYVQGIER